jgi:hypothetical protein
VLSLVALFVALGGTGYAALKLPKNSVGTKQLKKNAVTGAKVKNGSLSGVDIKPGSLTGTDISLSTLGPVPTAANATHATSADDAAHSANSDMVGGRTVVTFSKLVAKNTAAQTVLSLSGLTVTLACDSSGEPTLLGTRGASGSLLRGSKITVANGPQTLGTSHGAAGSTETIIQPTDNRGTATFEYADPAGHVVSVSVYVDDSVTINSFDGCSATGSAIAG